MPAYAGLLSTSCGPFIEADMARRTHNKLFRSSLRMSPSGSGGAAV